jgi:5-amino-6-(5-phosphoribosylamino)uracil reductase
VRPYVLLSCATSLDGYLDDASPRRLMLSNDADFDRVDSVRAGSDAIMVGAQTIRTDNPRLLVRDPARIAARRAAGLPPSPLRVTVTSTGDLNPAAAFFSAGGGDRIVYASSAVAGVLESLPATVVDAGSPVRLPGVLTDLAGRGVHRLMVEGGGRLLSQFLSQGLADELQLAIAPIVVADPAAPRFLLPGARMPAAHLADVQQLGNIAVLRYLFSAH